MPIDFPEVHFCIREETEIVGSSGLDTRQGSRRNRPDHCSTFPAEIRKTVFYKFGPVHIESGILIFPLEGCRGLEGRIRTLPVFIHPRNRSIFFLQFPGEHLSVIGGNRIVVGRFSEQEHSNDISPVLFCLLQSGAPMSQINGPAGGMKNRKRHPVSPMFSIIRIQSFCGKFSLIRRPGDFSIRPEEKTGRTDLKRQADLDILFHPLLNFYSRNDFLYPDWRHSERQQVKSEPPGGFQIQRLLIKPFQRIRISRTRLEIKSRISLNQFHSNQETDFSIHGVISIGVNADFCVQRHFQRLRNIFFFRENDIPPNRKQQHTEAGQ